MSDDGSSGSDRILVATENVRQITSATDIIHKYLIIQTEKF